MSGTRGDVPDQEARPGAGVAPAQAPGDARDCRLRLAPDAQWWPAIAARILELAGVGADALACDLRRVAVIVPQPRHAPLLRAALHAALGARACIAPRILSLEQFADAGPSTVMRQRAELFEALRSNLWVREHFGAQAGALWSLARDIAFLCDELTLAACGEIDAYAGRWRQAVQRNFSERAASAGDLQSQLVLALWRAGATPQLGAGRLREALARRAREAAGPLLWLVPEGAAPWQGEYCRSYRAISGQPALLVEADAAALAGAHRWLGGAWPELAGRAQDAQAIAERARRLRGSQAGPAPRLQILRCASLEEEAVAACAWTLERLRQGCASVALVALDRLAARRVRALLERAAVLVADESGWKLSTTSAAAAVIRWFDLLVSGYSHAELLDWLGSPFTLADEPEKTAIVEALRLCLVEEGVHAGRAAVRSALLRRAQSGFPMAAEALRLAERLMAAAAPWQQPGSLGRNLALLEPMLEQLGMRPALEADAVGRTVIDTLQQLREELVGAQLPMSLPEFRAFLAERFEELGSESRDIDSPVCMCTLAATRLRPFDAALLIGADAEHLPGRRASSGLLCDAVRRDLGLPTASDREREQSVDLAALLATTPLVAASWRSREGDEPRALAPLLERLAMVLELAGQPSIVQLPAAHWRSVMPAVSAPRAPAAPALLPRRVSAGAYQDLVDCPYRFFALRMLGLAQTPRLRARPDRRDLGLLLHRALYLFHSRPEADPEPCAAPGPDSGAAAQQLRQIIDSLFAPLLDQQPALIAYRERLRLLVPGYLHWLRESCEQGWRWQRGEVHAQHTLDLGEGVQVELHGRIDRIDAGPEGIQRILDYKTRDAASLRRGQRDPGEEIQLLFYGVLAGAGRFQAAYLSLRPPPDPRDPGRDAATLIAAPEPFDEQVARLAARLREDLAGIGAGAPMPANGTEAICRRCELRSLCRHGFTAIASPAIAQGAGHE